MARYDAAPTLAAGLLRLVRHRTDLTQAELASRAGVSQQAISAYETGRKEPTLRTVERLVAAAGLELRIRLEPQSEHDRGLDEYLSALPPSVRATIERHQRDRVASARLDRKRRR